ncbi:hypothetical protein [Bacteroides nordii]|uniref:hypothetical protein n=1 Tax=Bacteroides nordii TaxID=291645 RepID=UPI0024921B07|nr:hypothetical protein [Bacteroides nordii]
MPAFRIFLFDELCHGRNILEVNLSKFFQTIAELTREVGEHTVFHITVVNDVGNVACNILRHFKVLWIFLHVLPKSIFSSGICRGSQNRWVWIPFMCTKIIVMRLSCQEIGIENMTEFVSKDAENYLVSVFASLGFGNERMTGIDLNGHIIGSCKETVL